MGHSRPHTPANLLTQTPSSDPGVIRQSPVNSITTELAPKRTMVSLHKSIYHQLKSPLSPEESPDNEEGGQIQDDDDENVVVSINDLLTVIERGESVDKETLQSTLKKCLCCLSHYRLQNQILKFNSNETRKRSEIESELMKKQIDKLVLKSPFASQTSRGVDKPRKRKLVEKHNLHLKETEFNSCIKVFHLEK